MYVRLSYTIISIFVQIFKIAYSDFFDPTKADEWNQICQEFVTAVQQCQPDMLNKQKVHLMLHLVECMSLDQPLQQ